MPYTVLELITESFYVSGIRGRGLETLSGEDLSLGLSYFNDFSSINSVDFRKIPYMTKYNFQLITGQEVYFIPNLVHIDTLTYVLNDVRYPLFASTANAYLGSARVQNVTSLAFSYYIRRVLDGSELYFYYIPDQYYNAELYGRFSLQTFDMSQLNFDLGTLYERFYLRYFSYEIARLLCLDRKFPWDDQNQKELERLEGYISDMSIFDISTNRYSSLNTQQGINYALVNLGRGIWPTP